MVYGDLKWPTDFRDDWWRPKMVGHGRRKVKKLHDSRQSPKMAVEIENGRRIS